MTFEEHLDLMVKKENEPTLLLLVSTNQIYLEYLSFINMMAI